jgi:hypothetical protein
LSIVLFSTFNLGDALAATHSIQADRQLKQWWLTLTYTKDFSAGIAWFVRA